MQATDAPIPFSIRLLRRLQPLIEGLLASPLHGLLSKDVLLLTYVGRRSGHKYTLPLSYVERDGELYLCTRPEGARWWRNLRNGARVESLLRGGRRTATATILAPTSPEALDGLRAFVSRNPGTGEKLYGIRRANDGRPREADLEREVLRSVVVRLDLDAA